MTTADITIRTARNSDADALERLAGLDSQRVPSGDLLVAEVAGELVAAHSEAGTIADPFRHTADVVELLRVRSETATRRARSHRRRRLTRARLRLA